MDTSVSNLNKRLEDTKQLVTRNQTEALQLSEQYAIPANVITFSKTLLYFFNTNSAAAPTAALLEPFFSQEVTSAMGHPLQITFLKKRPKLTQSKMTVIVFKMSNRKLQALVQQIINRLSSD